MARRRAPRAAAGAPAAPEPGPPRRPVMGAVNVALGLLLLLAVWGALPARWWPGDLLGTLVALTWLAAGALLLAGHPRAALVGRVAAGLVLVVGLAVCTTVAFTASFLAGLYGPVGGGGAIILGVVAALLLPYLVLLPAAQLWQLAR